ncbi:MAG TPA: hypothetical protein VGF82_08750 [Terracidiphilus sp.]|jgi:hypothetical protein
MTHGIISTLSIAAFGLLAARGADLFRSLRIRRKPCSEAPAGGGAWSYNPEAAPQKGGWLRVGPQGTC